MWSLWTARKPEGVCELVVPQVEGVAQECDCRPLLRREELLDLAVVPEVGDDVPPGDAVGLWEGVAGGEGFWVYECEAVVTFW